MLITPDWDKPFILQTDASAKVLGYVLSQINADEEEHPIAFGSKTLLPREIKLFCHRERSSGNSKRHPTFQNIFGRNIFKIEMDHNPPTHLSTVKDSHGSGLSLYNPLTSELCTGVAKPMPMHMVYQETRGLFLRREECQR